ncbi:MAG: FdhF/YdeP family oxidoreductase [Fimbriimonadaceae bacterium]|nr:FdhF/YdeP family oxidoreductase [Fimbriimonadaceae bacterium]
MKRPKSGGGWQAIRYTFRKANEVGGLNLWRAMRAKNACKTCALGMGGQKGGMRNEAGHFPEFCKKSLQAMVADMRGKIEPRFFETYSLDHLKGFSSRELEMAGRITQPMFAAEGDTHYRPISWDEAMSRIAEALSGLPSPAPEELPDTTHLAAEERGWGRGTTKDREQDAGAAGKMPAVHGSPLLRPEGSERGSPGGEGEGSGEKPRRELADTPLPDAGRLPAVRPERTVFYSSGRSSNEAGFLLQLLARVYGTNHVNNCSFYCHQASGVGLYDSLGTGTSTVVLEDLDHCDLVFLIGGNPASNHPRLMTSLMNVRKRGGKVVVINPLREVGLVNFRVPSKPTSLLFGSEIASHYVQPKIGGDIALMAGIAKCLVETGAIDVEYVNSNTEGLQDLSDFVSGLDWSTIERSSGVSQQEIREIAQIYATSQRTIFAWTMGITHHEHGVQNVQWIVNLALLRGMVGKPGAGVMPIRGHSNVQGLGSVGVTPRIAKQAVEGLTKLGISMPDFTGYDTMAAMEAAHQGNVDFTLCLGGNLFGSNPDAQYATEAIGKIDTVVYLSTALNTGHAWGLGKNTLILPVLARDEESDSTTQESMFNFVRLSDGGPRRWEGPRSEVEIIAEVGYRLFGSDGALDWEKLKEHDNIRALIAKLIPGYSQVEKIGETKEEFQIPGRTMHTPKFVRPNGRAAFHPHLLPDALPLMENQVRLMTIRSEGQFNTVVYEEEDVYRGQERRDVILLNPDEMARMGFKENQPLDVSSECGEMRAILARPFDIAPGCAAMYYPEANILVGRTVDPRSKTPAFKSVIVNLTVSNDHAEPLIRRESLAHTQDSRRRMKAC